MLFCNENGKARNKRFHPTRAIHHKHIYILPLLFYPIELIINGERDARAHERSKQTNKLQQQHKRTPTIHTYIESEMAENRVTQSTVQ